jgi:hypothetical protein
MKAYSTHLSPKAALRRSQEEGAVRRRVHQLLHLITFQFHVVQKDKGLFALEGMPDLGISWL